MSKPVNRTPEQDRKSEAEFRKSAETLNASQAAMSIIIKHEKDSNSDITEAEKSVTKEQGSLKK